MELHSFQHRRILLDGWQLAPAKRVGSGGEEVSQLGFDTSQWLPTTIPATVLAALVQGGRCGDPYTGMNLQAISREPFQSPWWYRTEFPLSETEMRRFTLLEFDGINYAANIWLNGRLVASAEEARGAFRRFQYEVARAVRPGGNVLAVEVLPPGPGDFTIGFVDWNPPAPDRNMGLFRTVQLHFCNDVSIENPCVRTDLDLDTLAEARLTICADLVNHRDRPIWGVLDVRMEGVQITRELYLGARDTKTVVLTAAEYPQLRLAHPRLWWPHDMGRPDLHVLDLRFGAGPEVFDLTSVSFGIRQVEDYRTAEGHRGFKINGRDVLIKGAGWTDDLLLADTPETIETELQYVRHMNLNCIRSEGIWGKDETLYHLCDRYGLLMMVGWSCHWEHEQYLGKPVDERYGGVTSPEDIELVSRSWEDQLLWLRNHPSIFAWAVASDKLPAPELERRYLEIFRRRDPTRPYLASTGGFGSEQRIICREELVSEVSGGSGVKMLGPYEYTPPVYWYTDTRRGGAYGFNTETSPGAVVPTLESLRKMIPPEHLWPIDACWDFHCGLNEFSRLDRYREALAKRYGAPATVEEFARKAQTLNYELMRPMFEAFRVNRPRATGVIQWMLNAAWPKMYWQLYDWYLMPTGAFYGAKKACEPWQLVYHYGDNSICLVNDRPSEGHGLRADMRVYDAESRLFLAAYLPVPDTDGTPATVFRLPPLSGISTAYFLSLRLLDATNAELARNFYWLSTRPDVLDYQARVEPWEYYTPSRQYADLTMLNRLPPAQVEAAYEPGANGGGVQVRLTNHSDRIAFSIELLLTDEGTGEPLVPVFWQDNYVSLLPNETRVIAAVLGSTVRKPVLTVRGWNLEPVRLSS
ncbi:MAG: glycoside hydrolase family 2 [Planctomycetes bacterium]|nr:glycoside hydrolase family 2 [Planctomycetota bacterium]